MQSMQCKLKPLWTLPVQGDIALEEKLVPLAEDSTLATKILAGTRGGAGGLPDQVWYEADVSQTCPAVLLADAKF